METDPLQQLKDVHLPADPSWWPPAIGWWLLVGLLIWLVAWGMLRALRAWRYRAPIREMRKRMDTLLQEFDTQRISAHNYTHQANELIKRLLVRAYGQSQYAHLTGEAWLQELDRLAMTTEFSMGPGRALGDTRFSKNLDVDVKKLHPLILQAVEHTLTQTQASGTKVSRTQTSEAVS
ncbi:MAG: DUF4381 domain-containing protein [Gammaproteobacteria bacterium]|nr:DUF4381 domain-containing protein [Gammaproteobacteria bacterium]